MVCSKHYWVLSSTIEYYRALSSTIEYYRVPSSTIEYYWVLRPPPTISPAYTPDKVIKPRTNSSTRRRRSFNRRFSTKSLVSQLGVFFHSFSTVSVYVMQSRSGDKSVDFWLVSLKNGTTALIVLKSPKTLLGVQKGKIKETGTYCVMGGWYTYTFTVRDAAVQGRSRMAWAQHGPTRTAENWGCFLYVYQYSSINININSRCWFVSPKSYHCFLVAISGLMEFWKG